jgi:hypothetical protein
MPQTRVGIEGARPCGECGRVKVTSAPNSTTPRELTPTNNPTILAIDPGKYKSVLCVRTRTPANFASPGLSGRGRPLCRLPFAAPISRCLARPALRKTKKNLGKNLVPKVLARRQVSAISMLGTARTLESLPGGPWKAFQSSCGELVVDDATPKVAITVVMRRGQSLSLRCSK